MRVENAVDRPCCVQQAMGSAPQGLTVIQVTPSFLPLSCGSMETVHSFALGSLVAHTECFFRPNDRCPDPASLADHTKLTLWQIRSQQKFPSQGRQILGPGFIGSDQIGFPTFGLILAPPSCSAPILQAFGLVAPYRQATHFDHPFSSHPNTHPPSKSNTPSDAKIGRLASEGDRCRDDGASLPLGTARVTFPTKQTLWSESLDLRRRYATQDLAGVEPLIARVCLPWHRERGTGVRDGLDFAAVCPENQDRLPENPGLRFIVDLVSALSQPLGFSDPRPRPMDPEKASAPRFFMANSAHLGGGEGGREGGVHQVGISRRIAYRSGNSGYSTRFQESRHPPSSVPVGNLRFHTCSSFSKRANPKPNGGTVGANCPPSRLSRRCGIAPGGRLPAWCMRTVRSIGVGVGPQVDNDLALEHHLGLDQSSSVTTHLPKGETGLDGMFSAPRVIFPSVSISRGRAGR